MKSVRLSLLSGAAASLALAGAAAHAAEAGLTLNAWEQTQSSTAAAAASADSSDRSGTSLGAAQSARISSAALFFGEPDRSTARDLAVLLADDQPAPAANSDAGELAKKLSNPVASLISVPLQYNADFNAGTTGKAHRSYLNIQPVIPMELTPEWNVITRTIIPLVYQEQLAPGQGTNWGLGDTNMSLFFSPKEPVGGWILGAGPILLLPTATDTALGGGKWGAGPTVLALQQNSGWTYGVLASHTWSYAGDGNRGDVNLTFIQPFLSYQFPTATTIGINAESTYEWGSSQWTIPINLFASQVVKLGNQPLSFTLGGRYYAEGPSGAPEWGMRFVITFIFPK